MSPALPSLNDDELAELDDFLLSDACDDETLSVDEVHGMLTALQIGPQAMAEVDWLSLAWGSPQFVDETQQQRMLDMMRRLNHDIETTLEAGVDFEPLAVEVEEDGEIVVTFDGWGFGFMVGVATCQEQWDQLPPDEENLLAPMAQLALLSSDEEAEMEEDEYDSWVELLPGAVLGLNSYWHSN